jgi:hypothetical protein
LLLTVYLTLHYFENRCCYTDKITREYFVLYPKVFIDG